MSRKYTITLVLLALAAFTGGYLIMGNKIPGPRTGDVLQGFSDQTPNPSITPDNSKVILINNRQAVSATNSSDKGIIFYEKNTGKVFEANLTDSSEQIISGKVLPNFIGALWAPNKKDVLGYYYSPQGTLFKYYDYTTKKTTDFASSVKSVAFSPDGNMVAYFDFSLGSSDGEGMGKVFISQPDGSYPKKILDTRLDNMNLYWPLPDQLAFTTKSSVFLLTKDGALTNLLEAYSDTLKTKWSQDGTKLLFSYIDGGSGETGLWVKDLASKAETSIASGISASDCTWSIDGKNIICPVAQSKGSLNVDIYQITLADDSKKLLGTSRVGAQDVFLSSLEDYVLFTSPLDGKLYGLKITN